MIKIRPVGNVEFERNLESESGGMRREVRRALDEIGMVGELASRRRAPFLEGHLTAGIVREVGETDRGNPCVAVKVPVNAPAAAYAVRMHEDQYELGEKSLQKEGRTGVEVGRKYITRGVTDPKSVAKYEVILRERLKK